MELDTAPIDPAGIHDVEGDLGDVAEVVDPRPEDLLRVEGPDPAAELELLHREVLLRAVALPAANHTVTVRYPRVS